MGQWGDVWVSGGDIWPRWVIYESCMGQWDDVWASGMMYEPVGSCMGQWG